MSVPPPQAAADGSGRKGRRGLERHRHCLLFHLDLGGWGGASAIFEMKGGGQCGRLSAPLLGRRHHCLLARAEPLLTATGSSFLHALTVIGSTYFDAAAASLRAEPLTAAGSSLSLCTRIAVSSSISAAAASLRVLSRQLLLAHTCFEEMERDRPVGRVNKDK